MPTEDDMREFEKDERNETSMFDRSPNSTGGICGPRVKLPPANTISSSSVQLPTAGPTVTKSNFGSEPYKQTTNFNQFGTYQPQGNSSNTVHGGAALNSSSQPHRLTSPSSGGVPSQGSAHFSPPKPAYINDLLGKLQSDSPTWGQPTSEVYSPVPNRPLRDLKSTLENLGIRQSSQAQESLQSTFSGVQGVSLPNHNQQTPGPSQMSYQGGHSQGHGLVRNQYNPQRGYNNNTAIQGPIRQNIPPIMQQQGAYSQANSQQNNPAALSAKFRAKLQDLKQLFDQNQSLPVDQREQVRQQVVAIIQEFDEYERTLKQEWEQSTKERSRLEKELRDAAKLLADANLQIQHLIGDRSKISAERDSLLLKVNSLSLKTKSSSERIEATEAKWKEVNGKLLEKLRIQEEQLQGRRALWLDANPTSSARRDAMTALRDPFHSPSAHFTPGYATNSMTSMGSSSLQSPSQTSFGTSSNYQTQNQSQSFGPPRMHYPPGSQDKGSGRRMNLPLGKAKPGPVSYNPSEMDSSSRAYNTEPADDTPSMALVLRTAHEKLAAEFEHAYTKLFRLADEWVRKYTSEPNQENDRLIATSNQILWDYMMNCTYPGQRQDSHTHVVTLLNDPSSRFWFVKRMIASYFAKDIMSEDSFLGFSSDVDRVLNEVKKKMLERGLANEARQTLVDRKSRAIQSILSSPNYPAFRAKELSRHTRKLRDMMGPLLNNSAPRSDAGQYLGDMVVVAWELGIKMYTSQVSFQVYFPETAAKFTAATMRAQDTDADPMAIQCKQVRVKLVITPVITMRDDRGLTIMAKSVHHSTVLLMG